LPPLVANIREEVSAWRATGYAGTSATSCALLRWWFETEHLQELADGTQSPFRYYFAQREAVETVIWLHDVRGVRDKFDLLRFARFLDDAPDVAAFTKNYLAVGFKIDYVKTDGDLSTYTPDFIAKGTDGTIWVIETKGREELDLPRKMTRLALWCQDATDAKSKDGGPAHRFIYVDKPGFEKHPAQTLAASAAGFREYQT
jgi:hypothetical protein